MKHDPPIRIAKLDATINTVGSKYDIDAYSIIKYIVNGTANNYTGARSEEGIVSWIMKQVTPPVVYLTTDKELDEFLEFHNVVVAVFTERDTMQAAAIEELSRRITSVYYVVISDGQSQFKYGVADRGVVILKAFDDRQVNYPGPFLIEKLEEFIAENQYPWIIPYGPDAKHLLFRKNMPALFVFYEDINTYKSDLEDFSKEIKGNCIIVYADLNDAKNTQLCDFFGIRPHQQPVSIIADPRDGFNKYRFSGPFNINAIREFHSNWNRNKLAPYIKTDAIPEISHVRGVRILVGQNFKEVAHDPTKDVMVVLYTPWSEDSSRLMPDYERVASELVKVETLILAKLDYTINEAPGIHVKKFPTVLFYPADNKENPLEFDDVPTYYTILNFLSENASQKFEVPKKEPIKIPPQTGGIPIMMPPENIVPPNGGIPNMMPPQNIVPPNIADIKPPNIEDVKPPKDEENKPRKTEDL